MCFPNGLTNSFFLLIEIRIANVDTSSMYEECLEDEQNISNQTVIQQNDGNGHANIEQQLTYVMTISPEFIEQLPIVLASNTAASTAFIQNGNEMSEQIVISIPSNQLLIPSELEINQNLEQAIGSACETAIDKTLIESDTNKDNEMLNAVNIQSIIMEPTSICAYSANMETSIQEPMYILNVPNSELIDFDTYDNERNDTVQIHLNVPCQADAQTDIQIDEPIQQGVLLKPYIHTNPVEMSSVVRVDGDCKQRLVYADEPTTAVSPNSQCPKLTDPISYGDTIQRQKRKNKNVRASGRPKTKRKLTNGKRTPKLLKCDFCEYSTVYNSTFTRHIRTHTGERPYRCKVCQKSFTEKTSLNRHSKMHGKLFQFQCPNCRQGFSHQKSWSLHERRCSVKQFECYLCSKKFYQVHVNLLVHMHRKHTGEMPFMCYICGRQFCQTSHLARHMKICC